MWYSDDVKYNRFTNLDSVEDRIIYYLISEENKSEEQKKLIHTIWRILSYGDSNCLIEDDEHPLPTFKSIAKLIDTGSTNQNNKRIFRVPFIEDVVNDQCSMIRIYIDSINPINHITSVVDIGIETIIHNKSSNVVNPLYDKNGNLINPTEETPLITYKNRGVVLLKCILALLNGADVAGVGKLQFNQEQSRNTFSKLGVWNNRNYYGYKTIMSCQMSGVS